MTKDKAIVELVRIWHSPHLDLSLKAGLAEAIETLKEKNQSDSLVRDDAENCKESERKLDLIRRSDAIEAVRTAKAIFDTTLEPYIKPQDAVDALSALPSAEAIHKPDYSYEAGMVRRLKEALSAEAVQGWIPVSERLPENNWCMLVTINDAIEFGKYEDGEWSIWVCEHWDEWEAQGITAWMPLPEPYKAGDSE